MTNTLTVPIPKPRPLPPEERKPHDLRRERRKRRAAKSYVGLTLIRTGLLR